MEPSVQFDTADPDAEQLIFARNLATRYVAVGVEMAVGVLVLPFNVAHLGTSAYGLWMLAASVTAYFSVLDLGYSGALVKFVAEYRARRDVRALNEILSTMFWLFAAVGTVMYAAAIVLAFYVDSVFHLSPDQIDTARILLLTISLQVAASTAFSVFGGVINGFQRYDLNNIAGTASSVVAALVNVLVIVSGYGLMAVVVGTTTVRLLTLWVYRANAYRVFPALSLSAASFRVGRLREVTRFSVYMLLIDWANRANYSIDALVLGAFLNTAAVAVWTVAQRIADTTHRLTNQFNDLLFPNVVDHHTASRVGRLQTILVQGTRFSLASVVAIGGAVILVARPLVLAWVGPDFAASALVLQLLSFTVIVRVGAATATTLLKGAGAHRLVATTNLVTAIANVGLSILLVRRMGIVGAAIGTLVPVTVAATVVLFPAGCRRIGLGVGRAVVRAVWPALWPAAAMAACVGAIGSSIGSSLLAVGVELIAAIAVYAAVFLFIALSAADRTLLLSNLRRLAGRAFGAHENAPSTVTLLQN